MKYLLVVLIFLIVLILFMSIINQYQVENKKNETYTNKNINKNKNRIPKVIYTFWDSDDLPPIIQKCIDTWKTNNPDYKINILSRNNYQQYTNGIDVFAFKHCDSLARAADFIRLAILKENGGIWMDASIICTQSLNWLDTYNTEFVGYYIPNFTTNDKYPILENWFLACAPNSEFIRDWYTEFMTINEQDTVADYIEKIRETTDLQNLQFPEYLAMHAAAQKVMQSKSNADKYTITALDANTDTGPYKYLDKAKWDSLASMQLLCNDTDRKPPIIKLRGTERETLNDREHADLLCF